MDTFFFVLSKLAQNLIEPLNWVLILTFFALFFLLLRKNDLVRRSLFIALSLSVFIGFLPTSQIAMRALEDAVPQTELTPELLTEVGGILILGGAIEGGLIFRDRGEVSIKNSAERVTKAFQLIRQNPELPFIFSGGSGRLIPQGITESAAFKRLLEEQGLGNRSGYYETQSRNTYENFFYTKRIIDTISMNDGASTKPWLLVTSAHHMLRSALVAKKLGIPYLPILVDYQTSRNLSWHRFDLVEGARQWNLVIHEGVGIIAYWLTGKGVFSVK